MNKAQADAILWLLALVGVVIGGILTVWAAVAGHSGALIAGILILAVGAAAFLIRLAQAARG